MPAKWAAETIVSKVESIGGFGLSCVGRATDYGSVAAEPEYVSEDMQPGGPIGDPCRGLERAAREDVAVGGAMDELDALARGGKHDRVLADGVAGAAYGKTDRRCVAAWRRHAIGLGDSVELDPARIGDRALANGVLWALLNCPMTPRKRRF